MCSSIRQRLTEINSQIVCEKKLDAEVREVRKLEGEGDLTTLVLALRWLLCPTQGTTYRTMCSGRWVQKSFWLSCSSSSLAWIFTVSRVEDLPGRYAN
jgi:hypothetical protein